MSTLYLIRHGQASFGTEDYDRLSPLGRLQASRTGEYLRRSGIQLDAAYSGELRRQRETCELALAELGGSVPVTVDARFNEIRNDEQFETLGPHLAASDPELAALLARSHDDSKSYQKVLRAIFNHWVTQDCSAFGIQAWADYREALDLALGELMQSEGSGRSVALFTSGGTIATIVAGVLGLDGTAVYRFYEPIFNCSITQLFFSGQRVSLSYFNDRSFLQLLGEQYNEELLSYR
ncbi:histidine phosphatase family protein [Mangrovimicrobium sediminis]|uniref:Histidine phosphatase family protein n=1 Tax=Mangrovimicrobium sediminis TaxID=2562682 RepID=A0A4Z0M3E1_9GAMM|nr:histidine phosphatase family protein [Haliea sp. SAOS-164]TGD74132.1 histidine phosphatase family protein [Haliea sp. SAOS-164]